MAEANAYITLGLTKGCSDKEIKEAYVELVKKYDPEKHTERFMVIQAAYDKLRHTKLRAREDLHSYNIPKKEFLFQQNERWTSETPPDEAELDSIRQQFQENSLDEDRKRVYMEELFRRAHYAVVRKQFEGAIRAWEEILEHDPSNSRARHNLEVACANLGTSYALHGLEDEAMELFERVLKLNPDNTETVHNLAILSEKCKDGLRTGMYWEETIKRWRGRLDRDPDNEYLRSLITEALNHQEAIANLVNAARGAQSSSTVRRSSGENRIPTGSDVTPRPMNSRTQVPRLQSKEILQLDGPTEEDTASISRMRQIVELNPGDFDAHFQLCNKLYQKGMWEEAKDELAALARKHPKNTEVLNLLGWALLNNGEREGAFAAWKRSMSIDPKNPSTREQLVTAHLKVGRAFRNKGIFTQALVHFKQLLTLMPRSPEVHLEIAATYDMKGDVRSAGNAYRQVMALDPKNKTAQKALNDLRMKR